MTSENTLFSSKIYTAYPNTPIPMVNDVGRTYIIHLYQEGIIDSNDINIILDYEKDYPLRLFERFEIYYDNTLIASNNYLTYMINAEDSKMFKIKYIFPNYHFRIDTTNKPLEFKLQRNTIPAEPNNIKVNYKIDKSILTEPKLIHFKTIISPCQKCLKCGNYQTAIMLEHEPRHYYRNYVYGNLYDDNYSNKPIKQLHAKYIYYSLNDEKMENLNELHKGMNRFCYEPGNKNIDKPVYCITYYDYQI